MRKNTVVTDTPQHTPFPISGCLLCQKKKKKNMFNFHQGCWWVVTHLCLSSHCLASCIVPSPCRLFASRFMSPSATFSCWPQWPSPDGMATVRLMNQSLVSDSLPLVSLLILSPLGSRSRPFTEHHIVTVHPNLTPRSFPRVVSSCQWLPQCVIPRKGFWWTSEAASSKSSRGIPTRKWKLLKRPKSSSFYITLIKHK